MTNLAVVNATGGTVFLKASGAGTNQDPHITEQAISGTVAATGPLTNAELRAATVPVSGTVTATTGGLTDAELRDSPVPISGNVGGTVSLTGTPAVSAAQSGAWNVGGTVALSGTPTITIAEADLDWVTGTLAASGDGTVMAAPGAGSTLVINRFQLQLEGAAAQTCLTKAGTVTKYRALMQSQGDGAAWAFDVGREWEVGENLPVVLNLSGTASVGYSFYRYTRAV